MRHVTTAVRNSGLALVCAGLLAATGCSPQDDDTADQQDDATLPHPEFSGPEIESLPDDGEPRCEPSFELPAGKTFALEANELVEPEAVVDLTSRFIDDIPPVLFFIDGLEDGQHDQIELVGGIGERTGYGYDEIPDTPEDVFALYNTAYDTEVCEFRARLQGQVTDRQLNTTAERLQLDLTGVASLTEGVLLQVSDAEIIGEFDEGLGELHEVQLSGVITDEGFEVLLESVQDQVAVSEEQARELVDPDGEGEIPVEMQMSGRQVVVDSFTDPRDDRQIQPRADAGDCCPDGAQPGDSVIPYLNIDQQGLDARQAEMFDEALDEMRGHNHVAMILTARHRDDGTLQYEVYSGGAVDEGSVVFERTAGDGDAPHFEIVDASGTNPLENTDVTALSSYQDFLDHATNPAGVGYDDRGYGEDDARVGFVPADEMHYPFAYERITQVFDDPRAGEVIVIPAGWSTGGFGTHGNLNALQSRAPLLMTGPGIRGVDDIDETAAETTESLPGGGESLIVDDGVAHTDIAPTVAAALGVDKTTGVGPDMRISDEVYLSWQDGRVLEEVFTDEALDAIEAGEPVAERAVIIVNDGLTNPELHHQVFSDNSDYDVDVYRRLFDDALVFRHGAIATFPSNTFPGHNTIGAGAYSGHHGLVDNTFYEREQASVASAISEVFETEYLFGSAHENLPVETLHEAVRRTHGELDDGVLTASINHPSTRGADVATYERRRPEGLELDEAADEVDVGDTTFALPQVDVDDHTEVMDNSTVQNFAAVFLDHLRRDDGLPVPKFTILNMAATDTAGHRYGPHGDGMRYDAMTRANQRMEVLFEVFDHLEIDDSTLVVFTADHGMELQDRNRSSSRSLPLEEAGIQVRSERWFHYFKELAVQLEDVEEDDGAVTWSLRVVDRATEHTDDPVGVANVEVAVTEGADADPVYTDDGGRAQITALPDESEVTFEFDHDRWNAHRESLAF